MANDQEFSAQSVADITKTAQARIRQEKETVAAVKAKEEKEIIARAKSDAKSIFDSSCRAQIREAAEKGENSTSYTIVSYADWLLPYHQNLARELSELLLAAGFTAKVEESIMEPCGSDPMFNKTVYSIHVVISW